MNTHPHSPSHAGPAHLAVLIGGLTALLRRGVLRLFGLGALERAFCDYADSVLRRLAALLERLATEGPAPADSDPQTASPARKARRAGEPRLYRPAAAPRAPRSRPAGEAPVLRPAPHVWWQVPVPAGRLRLAAVFTCLLLERRRIEEAFCGTLISSILFRFSN